MPSWQDSGCPLHWNGVGWVSQLNAKDSENLGKWVELLTLVCRPRLSVFWLCQ